MKQTLLQIVQDICSDLDFDEVNSIGDTIQSTQVASIVKTCYYEMIAHRNWPHTKKLFSLESVSDITKLVHLKNPERLKELTYVSYAQDDGTFKEVKYKSPEEFLVYVSHRKLGAANTQQVTDYSGIKLLIMNNVDPTYYTSFDDVYLVFDSFDNTAGTTILASKTACTGYITPAWTVNDDFTPDLPDEAFPALFEEAKSTASLNLKQMVDQKADLKSNRQQRWLSRKAWVTDADRKFPDYGRKTK